MEHRLKDEKKEIKIVESVEQIHTKQVSFEDIICTMFDINENDRLKN